MTFHERAERIAWFLEDWAELLTEIGLPDDAAATANIAEARELAKFVREVLDIGNAEMVRITKDGVEVINDAR